MILPFISEAFENLKANEEGSVTANIVVATKITKKETDADRIIANAKSEIDQEVNKAKEELRAQVASLAIEGAQKILEKEIDAKAHSAMLTKLSKEL